MSRSFPRELVALYLDKGIDLQNRRTSLIGDIDEAAASRVITSIQLLDDGNKSLEFYIMTDGGEDYCMWAIHDAMRLCSSPVQTIGIGKVFSAGALLVAAGTPGERFCTRNTYFMVHQSMTQAMGCANDVIKAAGHFKDLQGLWIATMAKYTTLTEKHWQRLLDKGVDVYINAAEAIDMGIVDGIWEKE